MAGAAVAATAPAGEGAECEALSPLSGYPVWILSIMVLACLLTAALASGMTLGYMSLDTIGLEIISQSTNLQEAQAARVILPVRHQGNLLLVTLLLTNTVATELLPLVLEAMIPGGYFSLVASVLSLILFGEIIPQAICSRHALEIGAYLINFVKFLRIIAYPVAAPIAFLLDKMLGQELGTVYDRDELKGLIDVHSRNKYGVLTEDETTILKGTLVFSQETVMDVLTPAEDVYMLDIDTELDRTTLFEMLRHGHSRVPLYDGHRNNIVCLLLMKQLVLVDPQDRLPIRALINKKKKSHKIRVSPALHCTPDALLADVLNEFQHGRSHMAIVYDTLGKPESERKFLGIVTIEDIIEEILQEEIIDETDVYISNEDKQPVLVRGPDGKLRRSSQSFDASVQPGAPASRTSSLVATARLPGTKSIIVKEIDVEKLKMPLVQRIREGDIVPDWKRQRSARKARLRKIASSRVPGDRVSSTPELESNMPNHPALAGVAPSATRPAADRLESLGDDEDGFEGMPETSTDLDQDASLRGRNRRMSMPLSSRNAGPGSSMAWSAWTPASPIPEAGAAETTSAEIPAPHSELGAGLASESEALLSSAASVGSNQAGYGAAHMSLDMSRFPETNAFSDDEDASTLPRSPPQADDPDAVEQGNANE